VRGFFDNLKQADACVMRSPEAAENSAIAAAVVREGAMRGATGEKEVIAPGRSVPGWSLRGAAKLKQAPGFSQFEPVEEGGS